MNYRRANVGDKNGVARSPPLARAEPKLALLEN